MYSLHCELWYTANWLKYYNTHTWKAYLLFSPIKHESELQQSCLRDIYLQCDEDQNEKLITVNEKKIYKYKLLNEDMFASDEDKDSDDHGGDVTVESDEDEEDEDGDGENIVRNEFALDQLLALL